MENSPIKLPDKYFELFTYLLANRKAYIHYIQRNVFWVYANKRDYEDELEPIFEINDGYHGNFYSGEGYAGFFALAFCYINKLEINSD